MSSARAVGTKFETDVLGYLRDRRVGAERLARAGSLDEGDILLTDGDGQLYTLELKARRDRNSPLSLRAWLEEARTESEHYGRARSVVPPTPLLVIKNPQHSIDESFVVMYLKDFIDG